jgi:hypothetical protein
MMQNPLLGYSSFSHFLDFRQQQFPPQVRGPAIGSTPSSPSPLFMYSAFRQQAVTSRSSSSSGGSPSPPSSAGNMGKSFTIDAILGLRDANKLDCGTGKCMATDLSTGAKHPEAATVAAVLHHPLQASYGVRKPSQGEFVRSIIPWFSSLQPIAGWSTVSVPRAPLTTFMDSVDPLLFRYICYRGIFLFEQKTD